MGVAVIDDAPSQSASPYPLPLPEGAPDGGAPSPEPDDIEADSEVEDRLSTRLPPLNSSLRSCVNASMWRRWRRLRWRRLSLRMVCGIHGKYRDSFLS
jgi:hypothetical protein